MERSRLHKLLEKYREGNILPEELNEIDNWYEQFSDEAERMPPIREEKLEMLFSRISNRTITGRHKRWHIRRYAGIAAAIVLCFTLSRYLMDTHAPSDWIIKEKIAVIQPGCLQAELTLGDGSVVVLDSTTAVEGPEGKWIKRSASPVLDYSQVKGKENAEVWNTISVPYGGEFRLILSDGTRVWINSGSSLKYPVAFTGEKRQVELNGEAYFEVTKSSKSFVVKTSELDVRVLGTSFNVSAYKTDDCVSATLVTGSVEVCEKQREFRIEPGQVLTYRRSSVQVTVEPCDTDLYTSWIRGEFKFRDMRLEDIMSRLNRWYNCRVEFADERLKELRFSGAAEKDRPVEYLLEMIGSVTDVTFEIEKETILVKQK